MKWIKAIFTFFAITLAGMYGGQKNKAVRRFGIPSIAIAMNWKRGWPILFCIPILVMGYGENSWLMSVIHVEFLVRLVYALLLSVPFYFYDWRNGLVASVTLIVAFQVRAGSLGYWEAFGDILVEDIIRYGALGILISFNLFFTNKR